MLFKCRTLNTNTHVRTWPQAYTDTYPVTGYCIYGYIVHCRCAVCVGMTTMSGSEMVANKMKGKGVTIIHCYGDYLWYVHVCVYIYMYHIVRIFHGTIFSRILQENLLSWKYNHEYLNLINFLWKFRSLSASILWKFKHEYPILRLFAKF